MLIQVLRFSVLCTILLFSACTKDSAPNENVTDEDGGPVSDGSRFSTDCGTLIGGILKNPVKKSDGIMVTAKVMSSNSLAVQLSTGPILVKLAGIDESDYYIDDAAADYLEKKAAGNLYFYESVKDCKEYLSNGEAIVGQLFNEQGENLSEALINGGFAQIDSYDNCVTPELVNCYQALKEGAKKIGGVVSDFLWKPESDKNGNLAVLMNPYDAKIYVNGEKLADGGAGNGRGTTGRGSKPGCAYGKNVKIKAFDSEGQILLFPGGAESYTIADGCKRTEFK